MKRKFSILGVVVSAMMILFGILVMSGVFGGNAGSASSASYLYDSGYASFGADFYTYVVNNAEEAASASRTAANNLRSIAVLLKNVLGFGFICFGSLGLSAFGIIIGKDKQEEADKAFAYTVVTETIATDEIPQEPAAVEAPVAVEEEEKPEMTESSEEQEKTEE